jgi:hypothetical protein
MNQIKALAFRALEFLRPRLGLVMVLCAMALAALCLFCGCATPQRFMTTDNGSVLHWSSMPVHVVLDDEGLGPDWVTIVRTSLGRWNQALGFRAFAEVKDPKTADILIIAHDGDGNPASLANTSLFALRATGAIEAGVVFMPVVVVSIGLAYDIVKHELGHVLGLAHDSDPTNVMYEFADAVVLPQALARASAAPKDIVLGDVYALRARYAP